MPHCPPPQKKSQNLLGPSSLNFHSRDMCVEDKVNIHLAVAQRKLPQ